MPEVGWHEAIRRDGPPGLGDCVLGYGGWEALVGDVAEELIEVDPSEDVRDARESCGEWLVWDHG